jgi:hypothetical protein
LRSSAKPSPFLRRYVFITVRSRALKEVHMKFDSTNGQKPMLRASAAADMHALLG